MPFTRSRSLCLSLVALGLLSVRTFASLNGFNPDPGGAQWNRGDAGTGFAVYDIFHTWQFDSSAAETSIGISSPTWAQTYAFLGAAAGGGLYTKQTSQIAPGNDGNLNPGTEGEVLFAGGNPLNFLFTGTVSFTIRGLVLQVKRPGSTGTFADAAGLAPTLSINGGVPIPFDAAALTSVINDQSDTSSDTGNSAITSFYWNASLAGLVEGANNTYTIAVKKGTEGVSFSGMNRGLDGFEVDVSSTTVVPEPASGALILGGVGLLALKRRRQLA